MKTPPKRTIAIIPSAGKGRRLGLKKKPYLPLGKKPMLARTLNAFEDCPLIDAVVVVVAPGDIGYCRENIVKKYKCRKVVAVIAGGRERGDSVRRGLDSIKDGWDFVVVHDAARPFVTPELIGRTVKAAFKYGSAIAAVPLKDTVKEVSLNTVRKTIDRNTLAFAQTPQAFRFEILKEAYKKAKGHTRATDDSSLVERLGNRVAVVPGSYGNIKITTVEDLAFAGRLLRSRRVRS
ncbi:MAG: 2-C-methyl-D-erythritol 4-phosphate cytidylyltransferase [Deltaproteobacteria bacterium]|nr:2-C-methyl-D-erythritol 4-phosphate cytidylyltransferase [Deltaproteobacteria bacterium]